MTSWATTRASLLLIAGLFAAGGCGGGKKAKDEATENSVVNGKLVENNRPFALDASKVPLPKGTSLPPGISGALSVVFISSDTKESFAAEVNTNAGTFQLKGLKPGRYRIAITGRMGMSPDTPDYFNGKFTPEKTQILRDVKSGDDLTIDIAKPQG